MLFDQSSCSISSLLNPSSRLLVFSSSRLLVLVFSSSRPRLPLLHLLIFSSSSSIMVECIFCPAVPEPSNLSRHCRQTCLKDLDWDLLSNSICPACKRSNINRRHHFSLQKLECDVLKTRIKRKAESNEEDSNVKIDELKKKKKGDAPPCFNH